MITVRPLPDGRWAIRSPGYSKLLHLACKACPGMKWEPPNWVGYYDAVAVVVGRCKASKLFIEDPQLHRRESLGLASKSGEGLKLREYQREGISFLYNQAAEGALLADSMGLGKTNQALHAARLLQEPTLVVCPAFVRGVWAAEAAKWWPSAGPPRMLQGAKGEQIEPAVLTVINYDILHAWAPYLTWVRTVIFDEAHRLMSKDSRRSEAARRVADRAKYRIALSGTPMTSRPKDIWNVVDTICPGRFGKAWDYYRRFCDAHEEQVSEFKSVWKIDGSSNLDELHFRMKHFMLRRTQSDVALELPNRTRQIMDMEVPRRFKIPIESAMINDQALRKALEIASDGKAPLVVDLVQSHVEEGHSVVVFTHRRSLCEGIAASLAGEGIAAMFTHGGHSQKERAERIASRPTVLVATMDSVSEGIDLSYANVAVFAELDWVPSKLAQCEARLFRFGQKRNVLVQYVIAMGTADEVIRSVCLSKLRAFEEGIGKLDDKLREDLDKAGSDGHARQLKNLYDRLMAQEGI